MKVIFFLITLFVTKILCQDVYQIGTGIADITGPAADIGMVRIFFSSGIFHEKPKLLDGVRETWTRYGWNSLPLVQ